MDSSARISGCSKCEVLTKTIKMVLPDDLRGVIRLVNSKQSDGTLSVSMERWEKWADVSVSSWPDILEFRFECTFCHTMFELVCETYHGRGGHWSVRDK